MNDFGEVYENENLKKYSNFAIGGTVKYLIKPHNEEELQKLIIYLKAKKIKYLILGNCTNVIIDDRYFDGVVIMLDKFNSIEFNGNEVTAGAGVKLPFLASECIKNDLISLAFASMLPGNVGGSVIGNAGCYGHEIIEFVKKVKVMDKDGNIFNLNKNDFSFGYRYTTLKNNYVVLSATFILSKGDSDEAKNWIRDINIKRAASQPIDQKCVGSIFRNPEGLSAWKLISDLNLKGKMIGGAKISDKHANFIVNEKDATFNDVIKLIELIKSEVKKAYDITLVVEPTIIKWNEV